MPQNTHNKRWWLQLPTKYLKPRSTYTYAKEKETLSPRAVITNLNLGKNYMQDSETKGWQFRRSLTMRLLRGNIPHILIEILLGILLTTFLNKPLSFSLGKLPTNLRGFHYMLNEIPRSLCRCIWRRWWQR